MTMTMNALNRNALAELTPVPSANRSSLLRLYLIRGLLAVAWAALFARFHEPLNALAIALLVVYPLIDAVSSLIDYRAIQGAAERRITAFNAELSTVAAVAMGVAGSAGVSYALAVFGAWAVIAGAAQLVLGLRRRSPELGKQWPMLIAGGFSLIAGISYGIQAIGDQPSLGVLAIYATGGGCFFIVQAGLLAWRERQRRPIHA